MTDSKKVNKLGNATILPAVIPSDLDDAPIYPWNPFQDLIDCDIKDEPVHVTGGNHPQFMPRNAPFHIKDFVLKTTDGTPLVLGTDYVFANPFNEFIKQYGRNVFGSVILINQTVDIDLLIDYSTIGYPFTLDDAAYAEAIANMISNPRTAQWSQIVNLPPDFPPDPHDHNANETYDYREMMDYLYQMIAILGMQTDATSITQAFQDHIQASLDHAHTADKSMVGLTNTPDMAAATSADLEGGSDNKLMTVNMSKELITKTLTGEIPLSGINVNAMDIEED